MILRPNRVLKPLEAQAREVARRTGYRASDVYQVLQAHNQVVEDYLEMGYDVSFGHSYQLIIAIRRAYKGYDGLNKQSIIIPERREIRLHKLRGLKEVKGKLNKGYKAKRI